MIKITNKANCTGCMACYNVCPKKAIIMESDNEGFKYPRINEEKCIKCNLCEKVCPIVNITKNKNEEKPKVFAVWSNDEETRIDSTSGGVFSELANYIFDQNGYVCGAIYNGNWLVEHIVTNDKERLGEIRSSKYIQSDINECLIKIKKLLDENEKVLFCGTPCQVAALKNVINNDYSNLYICDFICRGVNSPKIFEMYLHSLEEKYKSKITDIKFKNKKYGWHNFSTRIRFKNNKEYYGIRYLDSYMRGYLNYNAFMRPSCYDCKFKGLPRQGDITLADFWGIENIDKKLDEDKGTSMVLINSLKGIELFGKINEKVKYTEILSDKVFIDNVCIFKSPEMTDSRKNVMKNIDTMSYKELNQKFFPNVSLMREIIIRLRISKFGNWLYKNLRTIKHKINGV